MRAACVARNMNTHKLMMLVVNARFQVLFESNYTDCRTWWFLNWWRLCVSDIGVSASHNMDIIAYLGSFVVTGLEKMQTHTHRKKRY